MGKGDCLTDEEIEALARGDSGARRADTEEHLAACDDCLTLVAEATKLAARTPPPSTVSNVLPASGSMRPLAPGSKLGRYRVIRATGVGGGGAVYEADDAQLGRRVALKVLHDAGSHGVLRATRNQLLREARAMARLRHPNVVPIHDVGVDDGRLFLVMEYVAGETLTAWSGRQSRRTRAIIDRFVEAGRGLAAAHRAGIVHGDFKPDNVLVDEDGCARLTDFGLAGEAASDAQATRAEALEGTRGFMAPEQLAGMRPDARSDQYSFCLALRRALEGRVVPSAVSATLDRGTSPRPEDRHASLDEVLRRLTARRRWRAPAIALSASAIVGLGAVLTLGRARHQSARCGDGHRDPGEECDDGNLTDGDGCSAGCLACGKDVASAQGWLDPGTGHCFVLHAEPAPWSRAAAVCADAGGTLAMFGHSDEARRISAAAGPDREFWLGLQRTDNSRSLLWLNERPLDYSFMPFAPVPTDRGGCVFRSASPPAAVEPAPIRWRESDCQLPRPFLCERTPWHVDPETGHRFQIVLDGRPWDHAEQSCRRLGAHLATITSATEQALVGALGNVYVWLGANDDAERGRFRWVTGEPFSFSAFVPGQPNGGPGSRNCLVMAPDDRWADWRCQGLYSFVCEAE